MPERFAKFAPFAAVFLATAGGWAAEEGPLRFEFSQGHMGTQFVVTLYAASQAEAQAAADAAFERIGELDDLLSDYKPESELSRLSRTAGRGEAVRVSDDLWKVLTRARRVSAVSGGAFDVTVGPYVRLWRRARRTGQMPSDERLAQAREAVGHSLIEFNESGREVELTREGMRLDLGAIAKGYAADEALRVLRANGITSAIVDAGGDLAVGEPPPGERGWRIGTAPLGDRGQKTEVRGPRSEVGGPGSEVAGPRSEVGGQAGGTVLLLANCGVATSGDAYQYVEFEGRRYSHIVDPRTGLGVTTPSSVTVIAPDGTTADALASALSVLGPEGIELLRKFPDTEALVLRLEDGQERRYMSRGMGEYFLQESAAGR